MIEDEATTAEAAWPSQKSANLLAVMLPPFQREGPIHSS